MRDNFDFENENKMNQEGNISSDSVENTNTENVNEEVVEGNVETTVEAASQEVDTTSETVEASQASVTASDEAVTTDDSETDFSATTDATETVASSEFETTGATETAASAESTTTDTTGTADSAESTNSEEVEDSTYHYSYRDNDPNVEYVEEIIEEVVDEPKKKKERKKKAANPFFGKIRRMVAYGLVFGLVAGAAFQGVSYGFAKAGISQNSGTQLASTKTTSSSSSSSSSGDVSEIAQNVLPSIVSITGTFQTTGQSMFGSSTQESQGSGSGIIVAKDSKYLYVATNNHVVEDATSLAVGFCDDTTVEAEIKGTDSDADLAVVMVPLSKIKSSTLNSIKIITMGDSDDLQVGGQAVAIGNALGYGQSVTGGYISAVNREVQLTDKTMTLIQTDAAINPGNSGGALLDSEGKLIGINTVKYSSEEVEGMGYAIPINTAKPIIESLIKEETLSEDEQAYLGITGGDISSDMAQAYGMPSGIYVSEIQESSPAKTAGLQAGDVIVEFDGSSVSTMEALQAKLAKKKAGTKVTMKVKRQSQMGEYKEVTLNVTLGSKKDMPSN